MFWTVVQTDLIAPTTEQLIRAYEAVPSLVAGDAIRTARYSFGVLAENLPTDEAGNLVAALVRQGVPAAAVNPADLPILGQPTHCRRLQWTDHQLMLENAMQRPIEIAWDRLELVAVGDISMIGHRLVADVQRVAHGQYDHLQVVPASVEYRQSRVILELIADQGNLRFQFEEEHMAFPDLQGRRLVHRRGNFIQTVLDILQHAPRAVINRGAAGLSGQPIRIQSYPHPPMFDRENSWLLWWSHQPH